MLKIGWYKINERHFLSPNAELVRECNGQVNWPFANTTSYPKMRRAESAYSTNVEFITRMRKHNIQTFVNANKVYERGEKPQAPQQMQHKARECGEQKGVAPTVLYQHNSKLRKCPDGGAKFVRNPINKNKLCYPTKITIWTGWNWWNHQQR